MKGNVRELQQFLGDKVVLVIEPSLNYRTSIKQFLTNLKIKNIKLVGSVADARRMMLTAKIGLFIVEWSLDEVNGLMFCRQVRKESAYQQTPFLILSVENLKKDVVLASEVKIDGYLLKPFSYEDFCAQIFNMLRQQVAPSKATSLLDQGEERIAHGDLAMAETYFAAALDAKPNSARGLAGMAKIERLRGNLSASISLLRTALTHNAEFIEAYRELLSIAEEREDRAGILQAAQILHEASPENPRYTLALARTYLEMGNTDASLSLFKKTVTLSPRMAEGYKGLGNCYLVKEEYERAMKSFKRALDLDEGDVGTLNSLGLAHVRLGQFKEGIERYLLALKLDASDARVLFNLGHAHEKRAEAGDFERAKWYYAQALMHQPGFDKAQRGLDRLEKDGAA